MQAEIDNLFSVEIEDDVLEQAARQGQPLLTSGLAPQADQPVEGMQTDREFNRALLHFC